MTEIIARIIGMYMIVAAIGLLINADHMRKFYQDIMKNQSTLLMGGIIALLFGSCIVALHNIWVLDWPIIITILGWWSIMKGAGILWYPKFAKLFQPLLERSALFYRITGSCLLLLGTFLSYMGWMA